MKKFVTLFFILCCLQLNTYALKVKVTYGGSYAMDTYWQSIAAGLGHTAIIVPVSMLNNTDFFDTTDILIVSYGMTGALTATQQNTIEQFLKTGKSVYIQAEYQTTFPGNVACSDIVTNLGGTFNWTGDETGDLKPEVIGSLSYKNDTATALPYYWYGTTGTTSCDVMAFLVSNSWRAVGWMFRPPNPSYGRLIFTTDQDWVLTSPSYPAAQKLMKNIVRHLADTAFGDKDPVLRVKVSASPATAVCGSPVSFSVLTINAGLAPTYQWKKNGTIVGSSATYSSSSISNGDTISCTVSGSECIATGSGSLVMNVTAATDITIAATPGNVVCEGASVSFPATITGAGTAPTYQWYKNGTPVSTSSAYSSTTLNDKDTVWVVLTNTNCNVKDTSNKMVMTVIPSVIFVDSSIAASGSGKTWATAKKTLTEALTAAHSVSCPIEIWVKKGTYFPTAGSRRDSSFRILRNNIKVYGGFAGTETLLSARVPATNVTTLSGNIGSATDSTDNSYHVMTIVAAPGSTIDTNTVLDGFTLTAGNASGVGISFTINGQSFFHHDGAGLYNVGFEAGTNCSPRINNCKFISNAGYTGCAMYNGGSTNGKSSPVVSNCLFEKNFAQSNAGVCVNQGRFGGVSSPVYSNCTFNKNGSAGTGGAFYNNGGSSGSCSPVFTDCVFSENFTGGQGGAMFSAGSSGYPNNTAFTNCLFINNNTGFGSGTTMRGGALYNSAVTGMTINNCKFITNYAYAGGGAICNADGSVVTIDKTVFSGNYAVNGVNGTGGAIQNLSNSATTTTVTNAIFHANTAGGSNDEGGGAIANLAGTISLNSSTLFANTTASTTKPNGNSISSNTGSTTNLTNTIVWGAATNHVNMLGTVTYTNALVKGAALSAPSMSVNPRFVNESNPIGADGIWLTADDGLDLLPCSPAVNAGTTAPAADIRNRSRVGLPDIGAYEEQGKPLPSAPSATSPVSYCQNATAVALTATKTSASDTLKWYNSVPALLSGAPTPSTATTGTFTWYVSQTDSTGCEGAKTTINVIIKPTPVAPVATTPIVYCQGVTATALTATLAAGSDTLKWCDATMTPLAGAPTPSTTTPGTYTYYVSQKTSLNCEGPKTAITVQVNPTPGLPTATTPITYCQNAPSVPLTATAASASDTLKWYNSVPALLPGAPTPSTATAGTFTFYVSQKNNFACEGAKKSIIVQINPTPIAPPSASPVTYCQDDVAVALTATKASSTDTLKWYDASSALLAAAPVPSTVSAGTTTYYVSAKTAIGCEGPKTTITVVVNPRPAAPVVITPINVCVGVTPPALTATGTNLKWYTAATGGTGTASLVPSVSAVGSNTYYVTQTNTFGCESLRASLTVNVRPSPVVTLAPVGMPAFVFCVDDSIAIKATSATATSYQWKVGGSTIPGSVSDTLHINTTETYTVIVKDMYGCADTESAYVMRNPLPRPKLSPVDVTICKGVSIVLYASPATTGYKYEWFKDGLLMGVDTAKDKITVDSTGYFVVRVKDIYNCTVNTNTSSISQYPEMIKPTIVRTGSVLKLSTTYASYQWYRNGKVIAGATSRSYTIAYDGDYHVVVLDANGCQGTAEVLKVYGLSIDPAQAQAGIRVYPNPTQGKVIIEAGTAVNVIVNDITGREILRGQQTTQVDLEPFADGVYMLRIFDQEGRLLQNERINKQTR
ncbi:MAG TPA: T9SS type A sorting domain-containing protein [Chitinophagaceae bacterium]|nr:T9SS type A sorting domain-containing protein [Chitinophagaceae bacterium]